MVVSTLNLYLFGASCILDDRSTVFLLLYYWKDFDFSFSDGDVYSINIINNLRFKGFSRIFAFFSLFPYILCVDATQIFWRRQFLQLQRTPYDAVNDAQHLYHHWI